MLAHKLSPRFKNCACCKSIRLQLVKCMWLWKQWDHVIQELHEIIWFELVLLTARTRQVNYLGVCSHVVRVWIHTIMNWTDYQFPCHIVVLPILAPVVLYSWYITTYTIMYLLSLWPELITIMLYYEIYGHTCAQNCECAITRCMVQVPKLICDPICQNPT